jgi:hypothetical protein
MELLVVTLFAVRLAQGPPPPPPPDLTPHREIAVARRAEMRRLHLSEASFEIRKPLTRGETTPLGPPVRLTEVERREFLSILDRVGTYSDEPGVFGCSGREFVVRVVLPQHTFESWFCSSCQSIFPVTPDYGAAGGFDAALSRRGAEAIGKLLRRVHNRARAL